MGLGFGGAGTDGRPREELRQVLRADGVERLGGQRQLQLGQPAEQLAGAVQTQLHVKGAIQVRIVDKALPADRGARLLKVDPHDNVERVLIGVMQRFESGCVLFGGVHVVDGAGTTDHQQAVIATVDNVGDGIAGPCTNANARSEMGSFSLSWAGVIITCSDWIWMLFRDLFAYSHSLYCFKAKGADRSLLFTRVSALLRNRPHLTKEKQTIK